MAPARALLVYLVFVFLGGGLLAPCLYHFTQWAALHAPALENLAANPFHRFVNRSILVLALAGLWPLFRHLGMRSLKDLGFENPRFHLGNLGAGFALGFASLAFVAVIAVAVGARSFRLDASAAEIVRHLVKAASAALVVALMEETLFRGAIFGGLRRANGWIGALAISSLLYAWSHFFSRPPSPEEIRWWSGLALLPRMMRGFGDVQMLVPGFFNLALAGAMLGYAYHRTGNLYLSIGLHAGWVFWLKSYKFWTRPEPGANRWLWGGNGMIDGWLALLVLAATMGMVIAILSGWRRTPPAKGT